MAEHEENFTLRYEMLEDADPHRIDAEELCGSILSLDKSIKIAAKKLYGDEFQRLHVSLQVEGEFRRGSILVSVIETANVCMLPMIWYFVSTEPWSYINLIRFIKKQEYRIEENLPDGYVKIITEDEREFRAKREVLGLYENSSINANFKEFLSPLARTVRSLEVNGRDYNMNLVPSDFSYVPEEAETEEETKIALLSPVITNVKGQDKGWYFFYPEEQKEIKVDFRDNDFLRLIEDKRIFLKEDDVLEVDLVITTKLKGRTTHSYKLAKVRKYNRTNPQSLQEYETTTLPLTE